MKLFFYEAFKIFSKPLIVITLLSVLVINGVIASNVSEESRQIESLYKRLETMSNEEKLSYLEDGLNEFEELLNASFGFDIVEGEDYITRDFFSEMMLYEKVYDEIYHAVNYDLYIKDIKDSAQSITDFAIFADENSFDFKNTQLAAREYEKFEDKTLTVQSSQGVIQAVSNPFSVFALLLITVLFTVNLVCEDIESGCETIVKSTKNGRGKTAVSRMILIFLFCAVTSILVIGSNFLISHFTLGLGDLGANLQSVSMFYSSWLDVTVMGYIVVLTLSNILAMLLTAVLTFFICRKLANSTLSYFAVLAWLILQYVLNILIPQNSYINILKYANIFSLMNVGEVVSAFINLNIFNSPVNVLLIQTIFFVIAIAVFVVLIIRESKSTRNKLSFKITILRQSKKKYTYSLFLNELYKHLISGKAIYVLIALVIYAGYSMHSYQAVYNRSDILYKAYINAVDGKINENTEQFIIAEQARFDEMDNALVEYAAKYKAGEISEMEYQSLSSVIGNWDEHRIAFDIFRGEVELLKSRGSDRIIYKTGYDRIFGHTAPMDFYRQNVFGMIFLLFSISSFYAADNRKGMSKLILPTVKGRKYLMLIKIGITALISVFVALLSFVPHIVKTIEIYGGEQIKNDINYLFSYPVHISILGYIVLLVALYTLIYMMIGIAMLFISKFSKRNIVSVTISSILFVIPSIILMI